MFSTFSTSGIFQTIAAPRPFHLFHFLSKSISPPFERTPHNSFLLFALASGQTRTLSKTPLKILIIPDKFKGTLTARQAGEAIADGWRAVRPNDQLEILPMSDGGDGFGEIIGGMMGAEPIAVQTIDAAHRLREAFFWLHSPSATAVIEAAQVNGLALLPPGKYHPFELDTFGLGKVYLTAAEMGVRKILVGIGGSSTNDGGFGFAKALGYQFLDRDNIPIQKWTDLERLERIVISGPIPFIETIVAVDVQNPLLGPNGASRIYGPQKGLREQDMAKAEASLGRLAKILQKMTDDATDRSIQAMADSDWLKPIAQSQARNEKMENIPGTGAAGGLGYGLLAFLNAQFVPGFDLFSEAARLQERIKTADLVISGEGSIDAQSLMGKGVGSLYQLCKENGVKFIGLAGGLTKDVQEQFQYDRGLTLMGIVPTLAPLEEAKAEPAKWLRALAAEAAKKCVSV